MALPLAKIGSQLMNSRSLPYSLCLVFKSTLKGKRKNDIVQNVRLLKALCVPARQIG
jgi:hypothetical protein